MMMRVVALLLLAAASVRAFVTPPTHGALTTPARHGEELTALKAYVPDGMTPEAYKKLKDAEKKKASTKNFGKGGARGFESRSMMSFQLAMERGEAKHLMPVNPADVKSGKIALKDVPYMQRGGSWNNDDLRNGKSKGKGWVKTGFGMTAYNDGKAKKMKENKFDKEYNILAKNPNQLGNGRQKLDWTSGYARWGTKSLSVERKGQTDADMWRQAGALSAKEASKRRAAPKLTDKEMTRKKNIFGF